MKEERERQLLVHVHCTERRPFKLSGLGNLSFDVDEPAGVRRLKRPWAFVRFAGREEKLSESGRSLLEDSYESIRHGRYRTFHNAEDLLRELND